MRIETSTTWPTAQLRRPQPTRWLRILPRMVLRPSLLQMLLLIRLKEVHPRKGPAEETRRGWLRRRRRRRGTGAREEEEVVVVVGRHL